MVAPSGHPFVQLEKGDGFVGVPPALEDSHAVSFSSGIFPPEWVFDREER